MSLLLFISDKFFQLKEAYRKNANIRKFPVGCIVGPICGAEGPVVITYNDGWEYCGTSIITGDTGSCSFHACPLNRLTKKQAKEKISLGKELYEKDPIIGLMLLDGYNPEKAINFIKNFRTRDFYEKKGIAESVIDKYFPKKEAI